MGGGPGPVPLGDRKRKKVFIPVDKYPDINFMGASAAVATEQLHPKEEIADCRSYVVCRSADWPPWLEPEAHGR